MTIKRKTYVAPVTELCENYSQPLMIKIGSGETTPEESDSNEIFFDEEEEDKHPYVNVWDNL